MDDSKKSYKYLFLILFACLTSYTFLLRAAFYDESGTPKGQYVTLRVIGENLAGDYGAFRLLEDGRPPAEAYNPQIVSKYLRQSARVTAFFSPIASPMKSFILVPWLSLPYDAFFETWIFWGLFLFGTALYALFGLADALLLMFALPAAYLSFVGGGWGVYAAEPGAMIYKGIFVKPSALLGTNRQSFFGKLVGAGKRVLSGERAFLTVFVNTGDELAQVAFSAPYPGKIIPVSLAGIGGELICQRDSFLCAQSDVDIGVFFQKKLSTALFGGQGFVMQRLTGDGVAFIHAGGTIGEIDLADGESIQIDVGCLAAFQPSVRFDICGAGDLKTQIFGGSGLFYADLLGPGKVWVQSLPFSRLAGRLGAQIAPKRK